MGLACDKESPDHEFILPRAQDFILSLDVESAFFHVPIHPKHRKFFSSHWALPLFVKNTFIELQPGGYFVCSRPDLAPPVPSAQTPLHLRHLYHQVVELRHAALPLGWTSSPRIWTSVMSVVAAALRRHGMSTLLYVDDLLIACSSFEEASRARQIVEDTLLAAGIVRVRHSRAASTLRPRPGPTIWVSASPPLAKEPSGFQKGGSLRCVDKHARCSSRQTTKVVS